MERKEVHKYVHNLILKYLENNNQCDLNDMEEGSVKSALSSFFEDNSARGKYFFYNIKKLISLLIRFLL